METISAEQRELQALVAHPLVVIEEDDELASALMAAWFRQNGLLWTDLMDLSHLLGVSVDQLMRVLLRRRNGKRCWRFHIHGDSLVVLPGPGCPPPDSSFQ